MPRGPSFHNLPILIPSLCVHIMHHYAVCLVNDASFYVVINYMFNIFQFDNFSVNCGSDH